MHTLRRRERGKPGAALAIIAAIFGTALAIKLLPPATRDALLPVAHDLPSRALLIWTARFEATTSVAPPAPARIARERRAVVVAIDTAAVPLIFETDPGEAPGPTATPLASEAAALSATSLTPMAPPMTAEAEPVEAADAGSPLVTAFTKTGSALRLAFVKTGHGIRAAALGTAGVFLPNP